MRVLLAGATGVIGRQAVPVLAAAGHQVVGLARTPTRLPDAEVVAADALHPAAVRRAVVAAAPDVIVHMLTAIPDPVDPRHLARDMAMTNRLRTQGTANLLAAAEARVIVQGVAYAYDPAGSPAYLTGLAGASNAHARQQLDWKPTYGNWRDGLSADLALRAPR
jgi:nucleoside-diphosphate-sugar epimerase